MNEAKLATFMKKLPEDILDEYNAAAAGTAQAASAAQTAGGIGKSGARTNGSGRGRRPWGAVLAAVATVIVFFVAGVLIAVKLRADKQETPGPATDNTLLESASPAPIATATAAELPTGSDATPELTEPTLTPDIMTATPDSSATPEASPDSSPENSPVAASDTPTAPGDTASPESTPSTGTATASPVTPTPNVTPTSGGTAAPTPDLPTAGPTDLPLGPLYLVYRTPVEPLLRFGFSAAYIPEAGGYLEADGLPLDFDELMVNAPLVDDIDTAHPQKLTIVSAEPETVVTDVRIYSLSGEFIVRLSQSEAETYLPLGRVPDGSTALPGNCFVVVEACKTGQYYPEVDNYERYGYHFIYRFRYTGAAAPTPTAVPTEAPTPTPTPTPTKDPNAPAATPRWDSLLTADLGDGSVNVPHILICDAKYVPELGDISVGISDAVPLDYRALSESVPLLYFTGERMRLVMRQPCVWQGVEMLDMDGNLLTTVSDEENDTYPNRVLDFSHAAEVGTPLDALVRVRILLRGEYIDTLGQYEYSEYYCIFRVKRAGPEQGYPETPISSILTLGLREPLEPGQSVQLFYSPTPVNYNVGTVRWKLLEGGEFAALDPVTGRLTAVKDGTVRVAAYVEEYDAELIPTEVVIQSKNVVPEPAHEVPLDAQYKPDTVSSGGRLSDDELGVRAQFLVYNGQTPDELPVYTYRNTDFYVSPYENDFTFYVQLNDYGRVYTGDAEVREKGIKVNFYTASGALIGYSYTNRDGIAMFTIKKQNTMNFRVAVESDRYTSTFQTNHGEIVNRPFYPGGGLEYAKAKNRSGEAALFPVHVVNSGSPTYDLNVINRQSGSALTSGTLRFYGSGRLLDSYDLVNGGGIIFEYAEFWSAVERTELEFVDGGQRYTAGCTLSRSGNTVTVSADIAGRKASETQDTVLPANMAQGVSISLGHFEQDGDFGRSEPIEWLIVKTEGNKALVVSRYVLYALPYDANTTVGAFSWNKSTLRTWLNSSFLEHAFSDAERAVIQTTSAGGVDGKLILLSGDEAGGLQLSLRKAAVTPFAEACGAANNSWWFMGGYTSADGTVNSISSVQNEKRGVRPAMWIELTPELLETAHYVNK